MDPGGSELDASLPQPENPCLIVEDSQPDSVALEDDPESSYRAVLARRLSSLQPSARSPVLELISSPLGTRCSLTDSQSESCQSNSQAEPGILTATSPSSAFQEESQVLTVCPPPKKRRSEPEDTDMDPGADSTTNCNQPEEGVSEFGFLELSQTQDLCGEAVNSQEEDITPQPDSDRSTKLEQNISSRSSASQDNTSVRYRSEVSSSSSSDSPGQSGRQLTVQALLHSQGLQDQQDSEILSSQEDMFDADKTGAAVDSTVSEPEQQGHPTPTPSHTLRLLHLSGQGTLVQESLSQSSVDYVAPTPDNFANTPLIVPSSPTAAENEHDADEPMDTSLPPEDQAAAHQKDEQPMEMETNSKPHPSASTPVSQNPPGFVLERSFSLPSQPEFSHDAFVPTQSPDTSQQSSKRLSPLPRETQSQHLESSSFALPLQLSVNTENSASAQQTSVQEEEDEDSQATQIELLEEPPAVDTSDSVISRHDQRTESNGAAAESQTDNSVKSPTSAESTKCQGERAQNEASKLLQKTDVQEETAASLNVQNVNVKDDKAECKAASSADAAPCSQSKLDLSDLSVNSCVQETPSDITPCSLSSQSMISQTAAVDERGTSQSGQSVSQQGGGADNNMIDEREQGEVEEVVMEEQEEGSAGGGRDSAMALVLSQSQLLSPEPMEEDSQDQGAASVIVVTDSERDSQILKPDVTPQSKTNSSQPIRGPVSAATNGHESQAQITDVTAAPERVAPEPADLKDKSLSDSSGEISFHFTLPKEGELIGPAVGATPPLISQLKQTLRHSTPIEITSFSEKSDMVGDVSADVVMATSDILSGEGRDDTVEKSDGKLSLRMKLVTPVEEGSSESFSLQKPALSDEDGTVVKVTAVSKAVTSPSVFSRVRQVHRQQEQQQEEDDDNNNQPEDNAAHVRGELFTSPQRSSQTSSLGCNSLPSSQSEPSPQEQAGPVNTLTPAELSEDRRASPEVSGAPTPNSTDTRREVVSQQIFDNTITSRPSNKLRQRTVSQQTSFDAPGLRSPAGRGEPESPSFRRTAGPSHCRHVRTIQEVRTTITRIITDVYYEDGKEVDRKVTEESEEPVVECQVLDSDISPCRTGSSSLTSGDLGDISCLSSKASSLQHSSGGTSSSTGFTRPDFVMPPSRGARSFSPRRGGGHQQRGHRGQRAGSVVTKDRGYGTLGSRAFVPLSPRGRARRGRPPSRSSLSRGGGAGPLQRLAAHGQPQFSSEDEPCTRMLPPRLPVSPTDAEPPSHSDSLRSSPEEASSAGSSFVGLRVVAKWSSNGYFYSGRIIKDAGEGRFRLRFDDGYECEVVGKDILLCDPIPLETEVTALLEDEYFSIGIVRGHKTEGQELFYSVERDGQRQWHNRTSVILSLEQGNKLREQHSLGPYEPSTPLAKASDISLDNLVEGKRRRRVTAGGQSTPNRSSSSSPRTPGPSSKRKLRTTSEDNRSPAKRGRRGPGARAAQRVGVCNTSGSGTDAPAQSSDVADTHGPLPQNASLFMGFAFMLTASSEVDRLTNKLTSDDEEDYVQTGPYNKSYTESQLQAGGGFVLPDFNEEQCKAAYQSLLIADQHCRTRKYLLCLASGVPCVSHIWVRDCCKENKLLNYRNYLLPAGVGPDDTVVEWHPRCSPFKTLRVLLVFEKPVELWAQLITLGGGSSVRHFQGDKDSSDIPVGKYDVVVTDHACPPLVEKNVTSQDVPLVSPEWIIQSVISGERLGFHSKPQYLHDSSS